MTTNQVAGVIVVILFLIIVAVGIRVLYREANDERRLRDARDARMLRRRENLLEHDTLPGPWNHDPAECGICRHAKEDGK